MESDADREIKHAGIPRCHAPQVRTGFTHAKQRRVPLPNLQKKKKVNAVKLVTSSKRLSDIYYVCSYMWSPLFCNFRRGVWRTQPESNKQYLGFCTLHISQWYKLTMYIYSSTMFSYFTGVFPCSANLYFYFTTIQRQILYLLCHNIY